MLSYVDIAENTELGKILSYVDNFCTGIGFFYVSHFLYILPIFLKAWFSFLIEVLTEETADQMLETDRM